MEIKFQFGTSATLARLRSARDSGMVTFTERGIFLGLGENKLALYDGISPQNYWASIITDTEPAVRKKGSMYFHEKTKILYLCIDGKTFTPINDTTIKQLDYAVITNKPSIEGVTLEGNKTFEDLGLVAVTDQEIDNIQ